MSLSTLLNVLVLFDIAAVVIADGTDVAAASGWSTGWGDLDPGEEKQVRAMAEAAQRREELARKELAEAREDEHKAEEARKGSLRGSQPASVNPLLSSQVVQGSVKIPSAASLDAAKEAEIQERQRAEASEKQAQTHMARATAAAETARRTQDPDEKQEAKKRASIEVALAHDAEHNATVKLLQAKIAHEKARFMQMQALSGLEVKASARERVVYMSAGGAVVALAFLLSSYCNSTRKAGEPMKEPLLATQAPNWIDSPNVEVSGVSGEEWRRRALEAMQVNRLAKASLEQVRADAERETAELREQLAAAREQLTAAERQAAKAQLVTPRGSSQVPAVREQLEQLKLQLTKAPHELSTLRALYEKVKADPPSKTSEGKAVLKKVPKAQDGQDTALPGSVN